MYAAWSRLVDERGRWKNLVIDEYSDDGDKGDKGDEGVDYFFTG